MKSMKKILYALCAFAAIGLSLASCSKDDDAGYIVYQAVGDIVEGSDNGVVLLDNLDTLKITNKERLSNVNYTRIMLLTEIISENKTGENKLYEVRVVDYQKVLTKKPLLKSQLDADAVLRDSVGTDKINILDSEIEAKYLNIVYYIATGNHGVSHFINLVIDDSQTLAVNADGELILNAEMRHNAFNDPEMYRRESYISFDIEKYMNLEGVKKITMNVKHGNGDNIKIATWEKKEVSEPTPEGKLKRSGILGLDKNNIVL